MAVFKDDNGRDWEILLTVKTMYSLKQNSNSYKDHDGDVIFTEPLDLVNMTRNNSLALISDLYPRMIAVYLLCKKQADARGMLEREFLESCTSEETLVAMTDAFFAAIEEAFPNPKVRELARKIRTAESNSAKVATYALREYLDHPEIARDAPSETEIQEMARDAAQAAVRATLGGSSGDAPQSSDLSLGSLLPPH